MSKLLFIAGKYWDNDAAVRETNVENCIAAIPTALFNGWTPFVPHLFHYATQVLKHCQKVYMPEKVWRDIDLAFIENCDAMLVLSHSSGVEAEIEKACELDIPIYEGWENLPCIK